MTTTTTTHDFDLDALDHCPFMPVFGAPEIMFERGQGTELWDVHGKRYLDFLAGIAVVSLGHANPVIAEAISDQARRLLHVSNFFTNPVAAKAASDGERAVVRRPPAGRARSSSPTREPSRSSARSSSPASTEDAAATPSSAPSAASTGGRSPRWRRPVSRRSTNRSSRCPRASATSRGANSTRCGPPSTDRWRRC